MTWTETHLRWQALRAVEAALDEQFDRGVEPTVPWSDELAALFGSEAGLLAALRYRCELAYRAQMDVNLPERVLDEQRSRLLRRTRGVRRLLAADASPGASTSVAVERDRVA